MVAPILQAWAWAAPVQAGQKAVLNGHPGEPAAGYKRLAVPVDRMTREALISVKEGSGDDVSSASTPAIPASSRIRSTAG